MANPEALGELAYTCSWIESAPVDSSTVAVCHGLLNINTEWHKKPNSVAAFSFLVDTAAFETNDLIQLFPLASVVTGTTGNVRMCTCRVTVRGSGADPHSPSGRSTSSYLLQWPKSENIADFYIDVVVSNCCGFECPECASYTSV